MQSQNYEKSLKKKKIAFCFVECSFCTNFAAEIKINTYHECKIEDKIRPSSNRLPAARIGFRGLLSDGSPVVKQTNGIPLCRQRRHGGLRLCKAHSHRQQTRTERLAHHHQAQSIPRQHPDRPLCRRAQSGCFLAFQETEKRPANAAQPHHPKRENHRPPVGRTG